MNAIVCFHRRRSRLHIPPGAIAIIAALLPLMLLLDFHPSKRAPPAASILQ
jgi:hypothetical protein